MSVTRRSASVALPGDVNRQLPAVGHGVLGVVDQVGGHLDQAFLVAEHDDGHRRQVFLHGGAGGGQAGSEPAQDGGDDGPEVNRLEAQLDPPLGNPRQVAEVRGKATHPADLRLQVCPDGRTGLEHPVRQPLDLSLHHRERGAQLMGDVAEQPDAARLGLLECGPQGVHVLGQRCQVGLVRDRHAVGIVAARNLPRGCPDVFHRTEETPSEEGSSSRCDQQAHQHSGDHGGVDGGDEGVMQLALALTGAAHHAGRRVDVALEQRCCPEADDRERRDRPDHGDQHMREEQPGRQSPHGSRSPRKR